MYSRIKPANGLLKKVELIMNKKPDKYIYINIFTIENLQHVAELFSKILTLSHIFVAINVRPITNDDIDFCIKNGNYLFIFSPQTLLQTDTNVYPPYLQRLPVNKYFLYQFEDMSTPSYKIKNINILQLIQNSVCTFESSLKNIEYYPKSIQNKLLTFIHYSSDNKNQFYSDLNNNDFKKVFSIEIINNLHNNYIKSIDDYLIDSTPKPIYVPVPKPKRVITPTVITPTVITPTVITPIVIMEDSTTIKLDDKQIFNNYLLTNNIEQIYISNSLIHLKDRMSKQYNLKSYNDISKPCLFFGAYSLIDFETINYHKSFTYIMFGGTDVNNFKKVNIKSNTKIISISKDIQERLNNKSITTEYLNLNLVDYELFKPINVKGNKIFIYDGIRVKDDNKIIYGKFYYDEVCKLLPNYEYIFSSKLGLPYEKMPEIYAQCFIGLRLTPHDGNANMVQEMEAMKIPVVHNQSDYGLKWKTVDDIILHINNHHTQLESNNDCDSDNECDSDNDTIKLIYCCNFIDEENTIKLIEEFKKIHSERSDIILKIIIHEKKYDIKKIKGIIFKYNLTYEDICIEVSKSDIGIYWNKNDLIIKVEDYERYNLIIHYENLHTLLDKINNGYINIIKNLNINSFLKNKLCDYNNNKYEEIHNVNITKKFVVNFIIHTYTCYNLINDKRKGNTENEINVMCNLTKICDVYYNDVYINDILDENGYIKIEDVNKRLVIHKEEGNEYYKGYEIFKPTRKYDFILYRGDYKEKSVILFNLLPDKKIYGHNYHDILWDKDIIGLQTEIYNFLSKNQILQYFEDDNTLCFKNKMTIPTKPFIRKQFMKHLNSPVEMDNYKQLLNSSFLIGIIGNITESSSIDGIIPIFEKLIEKYKLLNIQIIIIANETNKTYEKYKWITVLNNLHNTKYMSLITQLDIVINTWSICIYQGSNKNLDCVSSCIPLICPYSISYADLLGKDYPLFYPLTDNYNRLSVLIEKIINNTDNIIYKVKDRFNIIKENYNESILKLYYKQFIEYSTTNDGINKSSYKVCVGTAFSRINIGGVRKYIENIEKLSKNNVTLLPSYENDNNWKLSNYNNEHIRKYKKYIVENQQSIIDNHDIFHSNVDPPFIKLCEEAQKQGKLWVHTYHNIYDKNDEPSKKLLDWQEEINNIQFTIASKADVCICVGEWLVDECNLRNIKSIYIPNFIDISALEFIGKDNFKNKYNLDKFILFAGDASIRKNCKEFIEVAKLLPELKFVLIGANLTNEEIKKNYSIDLTENIMPIGPIPHNECLEAMKDCSIFVMNSFTEGLPTVLLETLYYEKPCIIPNGPSWSMPLLNDKNLGFKYNLGDINDLYNKIKYILENYTHIPEAKKYIINTFSSNIIIDKIDNIYKNKNNKSYISDLYISTEKISPVKKKILVDYHINFNFVQEIVDNFKNNYEVILFKWDQKEEDKRYELLKQVDIIYCEWAVENTVWYSNNKLSHQTLIVRLHKWELYTSHFFKIKWENIDKIIFIAPEMQRIGHERLKTYYDLNYDNFDWEYFSNNNEEFFLEKPQNKDESWNFYNTYVKTTWGKIPNFKLTTNEIKNGIDISNKSVLIYNYVKSSMFEENKKSDNYKFNIGIMGIIPKIKRVDIAIDIIDYLRRIDTRYKLFILSKTIDDAPWFKKTESEYYININNKIKDLNLEEHVIFETYTEEPHIWLKKIGFILSVSDIEGSHQAVAESMATGTIPCIYGLALTRYKLDEIYPKKYCFYENTIDNLCNKIIYYSNNENIMDKTSKECKEYAILNFNIKNIYNQINNLLPNV